jgi:two-component system LytT family sensor kinase
MIFKEYIKVNPKKLFRVPAGVIWFSSFFMGVLASIPKILQLHISLVELAVDASVAFLFSLGIWYLNILSLPQYSIQPVTTRFFSWRLFKSIFIGAGLMLILVALHQLIFSHYKFLSMMAMYEFRGILINLTIYMFLHLLYQSYHSQLVAMELEGVKAANLGAQYELLKQQVNPHFLFNSLNTLKSMVEIGDENAANFIVQLSDFYRFTLESRKSDLIALSEELDILAAYIYLLKARFEEGISITIHINELQQATLIPPFTLQLLIENCIKHNIVSLDKPLKIELNIQDDHLVVTNGLQVKKVPEPSTGVGLENINQRYLQLAAKQIGVIATPDHFTVKLPLIYAHTHH